MAEEAKGQFALDKPAQKSGADRYAGKLAGEDIIIYLPQSITRKGGAPALLIDVAVTF